MKKTGGASVVDPDDSKKLAMRYEAKYKGFRLVVHKLKNGGWQPEVIVQATGEFLGDAVPGSEQGNELISPRLVAYPQYLTVDEAKEKACEEVTMRLPPEGEGTGKKCAEAGIEWKEVPDSESSS